MKTTLTKALKGLRFIALFLLIFLTFCIGLIDRIILLFLFWKQSPSLISENYYRIGFEASFIRVFILGLGIGIAYLIKWLINMA